MERIPVCRPIDYAIVDREGVKRAINLTIDRVDRASHPETRESEARTLLMLTQTLAILHQN